MNGVTSEDVKNMEQSGVPIDQLSKFTFTAPGREIGEFRGIAGPSLGIVSLQRIQTKRETPSM